MTQEAAAVDYTIGNPRLPYPGSPEDIFSPLSAITPVSQAKVDENKAVPINAVSPAVHPRRRKKLIVLCDGTGQDSYGSVAQNPTNITRLARALAPNAWVKMENGEYEEWDQIVSYHAGIGTFGGNNAFGIMFGDGLSEIVRAAYGFLVNNWLDGDKIYIFGFSRGAYIARSIAGLVAEHGLLTKRGMDNFNAVYDALYMIAPENAPPLITAADGTTTTVYKAGLSPVPPGTVEVIGVFDTVGFHLNLFGSDKNEFQNTRLSHNVKYAFHALSLDEERSPFQTTLFFRPKILKPHKDENGKSWTTCLEQVWFSGAHSDVGGGMQNPRLSNISLAWMIDKLEKDNLLAFNQTYLIKPQDHGSSATQLLRIGTYTAAQVTEPWGTIEGPNPNLFSTKDSGMMWSFHRVGDVVMHYVIFPVLEMIKFCFVVITIPGSKWSKWWTGQRTPGEYAPIEDFKKVPGKKADYETCESLHASVKDRMMPPHSPRLWPWSKDIKWRAPYGRGLQWLWPWVAKEGWWPCTPLRSWEYVKEDNEFVKKGVEGLKLAEVGDIERSLKDRMRFERVLKPWLGPSPQQRDVGGPHSPWEGSSYRIATSGRIWNNQMTLS